jgi:hypothetical protein
MGRQFLVFPLLFFLSSILSGSWPQKNNVLPIKPGSTIQDTIPEKQLLFNGRIWRSLHSNVLGDEFLFTKDWIFGEVNINDMTFKNLPLRYDIYNDELVIMVSQGTFVQLNKELIKGFLLFWENKNMVFENFGTGPGNPIRGFGQVLYRGNICLIEKQKKLIQELAVQNKIDEFYQKQFLYILKNGIFYRITRKKDMLNVLSDKEEQLKSFLREKRIKVRKKNPESFLPVIIFYDNLKK